MTQKMHVDKDFNTWEKSTTDVRADENPIWGFSIS
jgi:hypothetical protein